MYKFLIMLLILASVSYSIETVDIIEDHTLSNDTKSLLTILKECEIIECEKNEQGYLSSLEHNLNGTELSLMATYEFNEDKISSLTIKDESVLGFFVDLHVNFREDKNLDTAALRILSFYEFKSVNWDYEFYQDGTIMKVTSSGNIRPDEIAGINLNYVENYDISGNVIERIPTNINTTPTGNFVRNGLEFFNQINSFFGL